MELNALSPLRHLLARPLDLIIWDDIRQVNQMNQLLHIWRGVLLQERGHFVPPCRDSPPVPPRPLRLNAISMDTRQQILEEVLTEDQIVPAAGLEEEQSTGSEYVVCTVLGHTHSLTLSISTILEKKWFAVLYFNICYLANWVEPALS